VEFWQKLGQLLGELGTKLGDVLAVLGQLLWHLHQAMPGWPLVLVWVAWWVGAVNWRKLWPILAKGAWAGVLLLIFLVALVWSRVAPADGDFLGYRPVHNFWWQLGDVTLLALSALFCGWLQGSFGRTPPEINLEPPVGAADTHGHEHPVGTLHGHDFAHSDDNSAHP
jgi:hypothetical protein